MQTIPAADPTQCPLCGQSNQCAMEVQRATGVTQPPCWCSQVRFDATQLSRIPAHARGQACLCATCANTDGATGTTDAA